jgi:D-lactate dehydrogenase
VKPKIALYDVHTSDHDVFRDKLSAQFDVFVTDQGLTADTAKAASDAQVIAIHVTSPVTAEVLQLMPNVKHVACRSTGIDHVDLAYAKAHDISVSFVPSYGEDTVAEYAFMLLLAVSRRLMLAAHSVQAGKLVVEKLTGHDLFGKTLGVVGTGKIGRKVAAIGRGFGMKVIAYDLYPNDAAATEIGFEYTSLQNVLSQSDAISLHAPNTPETHHMIDEAALKSMKPGVLIVNTARGQLIDTSALTQALQSGHVGGAGLDVLEGEELLVGESALGDQQDLTGEAKHKLGIDVLTRMPNVLITGHNAYNSVEALGRIRDTTIANVLAWHSGNPTNLVT